MAKWEGRIVLLGQPTTENIELVLLRGNLDWSLRLADYAIADNTDCQVYHWLNARKFHILWDVHWVAHRIMTTIRKMGRDGRLEQILGGPVKFIDRLGKMGYRLSVAMRNQQGAIINVMPSLTDLCDSTGININTISYRLLNGERIKGHYGTGHKYAHCSRHSRPDSAATDN